MSMKIKNIFQVDEKEKSNMKDFTIRDQEI